LKAEENPRLRDQSERQIDFRQFFPPPPDIPPPSHPHVDPKTAETHSAQKRFGNLLRHPRVGGSDWANLFFVFVTVIGGLFLSIRYFGPSESFRATGKRPSEFLYQRPAGTESYSTTIKTASSKQSDAPALKPNPVLPPKDGFTGRNPFAQVDHPLGPPTPVAANNGLPFVPATTSNPSSASSQQSAARSASQSPQASKAGATSGKIAPSDPTSARPTDNGTKAPVGPSRKETAGKQDLRPGKESCVKPSNRQIIDAQKLARVEDLRRSQENFAAKATRNFNGPGGAVRTFNSNRAGSFGAPGGGFGGRR
jgi:hypothetical protein